MGTTSIMRYGRQQKQTTADTGSDSMFVALIIRYKNYFVFLIFASLAMRENILTAKISRFTGVVY